MKIIQAAPRLDGAITVDVEEYFHVENLRPVAPPREWHRFPSRVEAQVSRLLDLFDRHGARTVFIARFVTGLRVFGALLAGASGLRWPKFLFYNATGAVVWSTFFGLVGYALAYSWDTLERWVGGTGLVALVVVVVVVAVSVVRARRRFHAQ